MTNKCNVPPKGWVCSRGDGHTGPCAASEENIDQLALNTAAEIMQLVKQNMPEGQLKASIQCVIIKALEDNK